VITFIIRNATPRQLNCAIEWTADNLHIPGDTVTNDVAVAYVCKHFKAGQLSGRDGFVKDLEG
jgi:hypothetical protein